MHWLEFIGAMFLLGISVAIEGKIYSLQIFVDVFSTVFQFMVVQMASVVLIE